MLYRIVAPHFVAGIVLGTPNTVPPILKYMKKWNLLMIRSYCRQKGWNLELVLTSGLDSESSVGYTELKASVGPIPSGGRTERDEADEALDSSSTDQ